MQDGSDLQSLYRCLVWDPYDLPLQSEGQLGLVQDLWNDVLLH